jgi:hypothetical protein
LGLASFVFVTGLLSAPACELPSSEKTARKKSCAAVRIASGGSGVSPKVSACSWGPGLEERTHFVLDNVLGGSKFHFTVPVQMAFDGPNMKEMG